MMHGGNSGISLLWINSGFLSGIVVSKCRFITAIAFFRTVILQNNELFFVTYLFLKKIVYLCAIQTDKKMTMQQINKFWWWRLQLSESRE
ncbi:hypothetical protein FHX64_001952 [Microbacter margulisiae]|uniref:Uncharacterized protein n=1 Tax=Microbacter margulisiae TaxID=1350067 RepID=A0A7W5DRH2_9PORP|nr:hypothetical protein [Microbacter margulisiae]